MKLFVKYAENKKNYIFSYLEKKSHMFYDLKKKKRFCVLSY